MASGMAITALANLDVSAVALNVGVARNKHVLR